METPQNKLPEKVIHYLNSFKDEYGYTLKIIPKNSSKLMKIIGWFFGVTKISTEFMTRYITIIGDTVYYPDNLLSNPDETKMLRTVVHESVHLYDSQKFKFLFKFLYLFPQSMAIFSLLTFLAFWKIGFLWCLLFLLCLAPIPAPFRYWFELRAYRTQLMFSVKADKATEEQITQVYEWIEKQMATSLYYWTWPFKSMIRKNLQDQSSWNTGIHKFINRWIICNNIIEKYKQVQELRNK